jgi:hypothetical protein
MKPRARRRFSGVIAPYPGDLVILEGWGHPDPLTRARVVCITMMPGDPLIPPPDPEFSAFIDRYLSGGGAAVLADFRTSPELTDSHE